MKLIALFILMQMHQVTPSPSLSLPSIFSDNMVLQQRVEAPFWGHAKPGKEVIVKATWGGSVKTLATKDGSWMIKLKTPRAGGPYEVTIKSEESQIVYKNVLVGEVWFCSGQSNMELPLAGEPPAIPIKNSEEAIRNARYPHMRFFKVARALSVSPESDCTGEWKECDSLAASQFSATAFFFGRSLYNKLKVPVGLIQSSWGGTPVQAWTSDRYLREGEKLDSSLDKIDINRDDIIRQTKWMRQSPIIDVSKKLPSTRWQNLGFDDEECSKPDYDDQNWKTMNLPTLWENTQLGEFDGTVWFRKRIPIPNKWTHSDLVLSLGPIDDADRAYVNGRLIGKTEEAEQWRKDCLYNVPEDLVTDSLLTLAVRVIDYGGGGGMYGDKSKMTIHRADSVEGVSVDGSWKYLPVAEYLYSKFYVYGARGERFYARPNTAYSISSNSPTVLYNAMVAPTIPYTIKGAIWYQGESNTIEPRLYRKLLPLMIRNWREDWNEGEFPFYFVQIAPYDYGDSVRSQVLRESQLFTLSTPRTGMAVTLDIGEPNNIHPADKQSVGERLARWALAKDYSKRVPYSGPLYRSMKVEGDSIIVSFDFAGKGLVLKEDSSKAVFSIAGEDRHFVKADASVHGKQLVLHSAQVRNPVSVRYAWSNIARGTLFNVEGLPASSFRTDDWDN